jgi:hypothetical protein
MHKSTPCNGPVIMHKSIVLSFSQPSVDMDLCMITGRFVAGLSLKPLRDHAQIHFMMRVLTGSGEADLVVD